MKYAADFRYIAREALRGKWLIAVVVGLVAALLGGAGADGPEVKLNIDASGAHASFEYAGQTIFSTGGGLNSEIGAFLVGSAIYITIAAIVMAVVYFVLGSIIETGYARFNLKLVDHQEASFEPLFTYFTYWKTMAVARLLRSIYVLLWSLLLVIPGIIASYSYAMTSFLLAERPELEAGETVCTVQGQYAILKPEHKKDVENFYAAQREQHIQGTRELQAEITANGSVKLTDEQKAALSEKYDPNRMSREDYVSFVDDLYEYGILEGDDRNWVQAKAGGLTLADLGATHTFQISDAPYQSTHFEDCGGNVLNWAKYMSRFEYYDELLMDFAPTKSALLFGKIEDALSQI